MKSFVFVFLLAVLADYKADQLTWLEENLSVEGVMATSSGLQYQVLKEGDGKHFPKATDRVKTHYFSTLIGGIQLDSTYDRKTPAVFPVYGAIKGLTEGLQLQSVGSKYRFFIKSELGFGASGFGRKVPGDSTVIYTVELLEINGNDFKGELQSETGVGDDVCAFRDCASCLDDTDNACVFYDGTCIASPNNPSGYKQSKFVWWSGFCPSTANTIGVKAETSVGENAQLRRINKALKQALETMMN